MSASTPAPSSSSAIVRLQLWPWFRRDGAFAILIGIVCAIGAEVAREMMFPEHPIPFVFPEHMPPWVDLIRSLILFIMQRIAER